MSTTRYLIDRKHQRSFCLGDRYYSELFNDTSRRPLSAAEIFEDMRPAGETATSGIYDEALATCLLEFCEAAEWDIELRYDSTEYERGRWGDDGFARVGSVWGKQ